MPIVKKLKRLVLDCFGGKILGIPILDDEQGDALTR